MPDISITALMSDVSGNIEAVWTDSQTGYVVFIDATRQFVFYRKTTDGGATWGAVVTVHDAGAINRIPRIDVWFENWTPERPGGLIWIIIGNESTGVVSLHTVDTSASDAIAVVNASIAVSSFTIGVQFPICQTRNGAMYLFIMLGAAGTNQAFKSNNGGVTWASITTPLPSTATVRARLVPSVIARDAWAIIWDDTTNLLHFAEYSTDTNTWTLMSLGAATNPSFGATVSILDSRVYVASIAAPSSSSGINIHSIGGATDIITRAQPLADATNVDHVTIFIDNRSALLYCCYVQGTLNDSVDIFYQFSPDKGQTWIGPNQLNDDAADDHRLIITARMSDIRDGGRFQPIWFNDDLNTLLTNTDNGVVFDLTYNGRQATFGGVFQVEADCVQVPQFPPPLPAGALENANPLVVGGWPDGGFNTAVIDTNYYAMDLANLPSDRADGFRVRGLTSRATALWWDMFRRAVGGEQVIVVTNVLAGPGGVAFIPGETLQVLDVATLPVPTPYILGQPHHLRRYELGTDPSGTPG